MEKMFPIKNSEEISKIINLKLRKKPITKYLDSPGFDQAMDLFEKLEESNTTHVDINPGNIMQNANGEIKLIDLDSVIVH
jgi:thiamine kinase-like enzyme